MVKLLYNPKTNETDIIAPTAFNCTPAQSDQVIIFRNYILNAVRKKITLAKGDKNKILDALMILDNNQFKALNYYVKNGNMIVEYEMQLD